MDCCCCITVGMLLLSSRASLWAGASCLVANLVRVMVKHHACRVVTPQAQGLGVSPYMGRPSRTKWTPGCCTASEGSSAWPTAGKTPMAGGRCWPAVCTHAGQFSVGGRRLTSQHLGVRASLTSIACAAACLSKRLSCCPRYLLLPGSIMHRAGLAVQSLACACPLCSLPSRSPACCRSQFFILFKSAAHLNFKHTVFGKLVGGELPACMTLVIRPIQEQPSSTGLTPLAVAMGGGGLLPSHSRCAPLSLQFPAAGLNVLSAMEKVPVDGDDRPEKVSLRAGLQSCAIYCLSTAWVGSYGRPQQLACYHAHRVCWSPQLYLHPICALCVRRPSC